MENNDDTRIPVVDDDEPTKSPLEEKTEAFKVLLKQRTKKDFSVLFSEKNGNVPAEITMIVPINVDAIKLLEKIGVTTYIKRQKGVKIGTVQWHVPKEVMEQKIPNALTQDIEDLIDQLEGDIAGVGITKKGNDYVLEVTTDASRTAVFGKDASLVSKSSEYLITMPESAVDYVLGQIQDKEPNLRAR